MFKHIFTISVIFCTSSYSAASEVDSFTGRYSTISKLSPINDALDAKVNDLMQDELEKLNSKIDCRQPSARKLLLSKMHHRLGAPVALGNELDPWLRNNPQTGHVSFYESIYSDFGKMLSPWTVIGPLDPHAMSRMVRYDLDSPQRISLLIGTDKFTHFFGVGYTLFRTGGSKQPSLEEALGKYIRRNRVHEFTMFGVWITNIASFGDIASNLQGLRFWSVFLDSKYNTDFFTGEKVRPYVVCLEDGKWKLNRKFQSIDYVDAAWDESINCSAFATGAQLKSANEKVNKLEQADPANRYQCPVDLAQIPILKAKYGPFAKHVLNLDGFRKVKSRRQSIE